MKTFRYMAEAAALHLAFLIFRLMPVAWASAAGGVLARTVGPHLAVSRKALRNLERALPARAAEHPAILRAMWDNLGRTFAEYPHLQTIAGASYTDIIGFEHLDGLRGGKNAVMVGGHLANWELGGPAFFTQHGLVVNPVFRPPNNRYVAGLLDRCRRLDPSIAPIPKSRAGTRLLVDSVKNGINVGILIDQKYNEGLAIPFFGHLAMTSPAFVQLAQKFDVPLIPIQVERTGGPHFRITIYPPMDIRGRPVEDVMAQAHAHLEQWIAQNPGQWLWLHRRWKMGHPGALAE